MADQAERRQVYAIVRGIVQGVGFRYHTLAKATEFGVSGWVKNRSDGAVEVLCEGPANAVEQMLAWLHRGPGSAHVSDVYTQERTPTGLRSFEVTY